MGEVYETLDLRTGQRVALKTALSTACDSPHAASWLEQEFRWSRRVKHPNIRRMFEFGRHADTNGAVYFVSMELLVGESLGQKLERGPLPLAQACDVFRELLLGLEALHTAGVVHQDVKSDNIILVVAADDRRAVLTDLALAEAWSGTPQLRLSQRLVGTPAYMTPEQLLGSSRIDAASDVFALGVVLFEMLTARLPWGRPHERVAWSPLAHRIIPPSQLRRAVPRGLDQFVLQCLSSERSLRFPCARTAMAAFDQACSGAEPRTAGLAHSVCA
jgi:serine/threonine-protein kinase